MVLGSGWVGNVDQRCVLALFAVLSSSDQLR